MNRSAGILLYRRTPQLEVLIGHLGGPFWSRKDEQAWTFPKGLVDEGEDEFAGALREFGEEIGTPAPDVPYADLGTIRNLAGDLGLPPEGNLGPAAVADDPRGSDAATANRLKDALERFPPVGGQFAGFDFGGMMQGTGRFIGHGGGAPGMSGSLQHFLDSGVTVIVLANRDPGAAESIAIFAAHRLPAN